jgi:hydroxymethylpyrimidine kinase/phosphomethylpyrimidine kinase/thiamine-phosphate diphosphorylase
MEAAAQHLHTWGCSTVLIKGGHLAERQQQQQQQTDGTPAAAAAAHVVDVLYDGKQFHYFTAPYIHTSNAHGTGCTLGAAIATALAASYSPVAAVAAAKGYLTATLAASSSLNLGQGPQHPFNHAAGLSSVTGLLNPVQERVQTLQGLGQHRLNPVDLRVYVVTDAGCNAKCGRSLMQAVAGAVAGGATVVQLREKDIDGGDFLKEARAVVEVRCAGGGGMSV